MREVAELAMQPGVILLGEEPEVVADRQEALEQRFRVGEATHHRVVVDEPEAADQECGLVAGQAVDAGVGRVAVDEAVAGQPALDRGDRRQHARIVGRQEAHVRDQQHARVERVGAVRLRERADALVVPARQQVGADVLAQRAPARQSLYECRRRVLPEPLDVLDAAIHRHPRHQLGVDEVQVALAADLPDALVGLLPDPLDEVDDHRQLIPRNRRVARDAARARLVERVERLAVDIELELVVRPVADANRRGLFVARQPRQLDLGEAVLAAHAVHDLRVRRRAGDRAQQPVHPRARLLGVATEHQGVERERGIAQPAVAIVPVANATELFGKPGRRRRDDAAGRRVRQRLQRDQRTDHGVAVRAVVLALGRPLAPVALGARQLLLRIDRRVVVAEVRRVEGERA